MVVAVIIAIPLGIIAAVRKGTRVDHGATTLALVGISMPTFWLGPLLAIVFSVELGWFPVSGRGTIANLVLPALTLGLFTTARTMRLTRSALLEVLGQDYVRTARAKGVAERGVVWKHALRNAAIPVITIVGLELGTLLGGAVITETIFAWPGVGRLSVQAIYNRDYPLVQASVFGLSHEAGLQIAFTFLLGLIAGWLVRRSGGLATSWLFHALNNLGALVLIRGLPALG